MSIIVDNSVTGVHFKEADATSVYIGSALVRTFPPPLIHTPTTINKLKLRSPMYTSTDPVFKRSLYPLDADAIDISLAGDGSVTFKNNRWYSQHTPVYLEADCSGVFSGLNNITHLDFRGLDTSNLITADSMFSSLNNVVEIDLSEMDTSNVSSMMCMFFTSGLMHHVNVKYGPKFLPTSLKNLSKDRPNSTYRMFGDYIDPKEPEYQYQITKPWNPDNWYHYKGSGGGDNWIYTSNLP